MSQSLLRGLSALELIQAEPRGVSELARELGVDKAGVSRVLAGLAREGWVQRTGTRYVLGPRALGMGWGAPADILGYVTDIVGGIGRRLGVTAVALKLTGLSAQPLATWQGPEFREAMQRPAPFAHAVRTAGGVALLSQLSDQALKAAVDSADWAGLSPDAPSSWEQLLPLIARLRAGDVVVEHAWSVEGLSCVASDWPALGLEAPTALAVVGPTMVIAPREEEISSDVRATVVG